MCDLDFPEATPPDWDGMPRLDTIPDEKMRTLYANLLKDGPCTVPDCKVCSGEMTRRGT